MNFLRGFFSIGIIIGCVINWVSIELEIGSIGTSGLDWSPAIILLLASFLTAGYAFYNSYNNSNQNTWIYLTCGLYGVGIFIFRYLSLEEYVNSLYESVPNAIDHIAFTYGLGFYLTGLFSVLLFLTGFDKADNKSQITQQHFDHQFSNPPPERLVKSEKPNLLDWLKENPEKSINDYYSKYK